MWPRVNVGAQGGYPTYIHNTYWVPSPYIELPVHPPRVLKPPFSEGGEFDQRFRYGGDADESMGQHPEPTTFERDWTRFGESEASLRLPPLRNQPDIRHNRILKRALAQSWSVPSSSSEGEETPPQTRRNAGGWEEDDWYNSYHEPRRRRRYQGPIVVSSGDEREEDSADRLSDLKGEGTSTKPFVLDSSDSDENFEFEYEHHDGDSSEEEHHKFFESSPEVEMFDKPPSLEDIGENNADEIPDTNREERVEGM